jgi:hypothetical protein
MRKYLVVAAIVMSACWAGCSGDTPKGTQMDAGTNLAFGATCGSASDTSTECTSGVCTNSFDMLGYNICSQKCTNLMAIDTTCPTGTSQMCNKKGYCKP